MDTCAVDGMCATDCPVSINTGELIKRLRRENHSNFANKTAMQVAKNFSLVERMVKLALRTGNVVNSVTGKQSMKKLTCGIRTAVSGFPLWTDSITKPVRIKASQVAAPDAVYFPSCITRMMGADKEDSMPVSEVVKTLCNRAGLSLFIADHTTGVCCGQLFSSKGFMPAYKYTVNETIDKLWAWSQQGKVPVLMDVTSCTHSLQTSAPYLTEENKKRFEQLVFIDSIDFAADYLLQRLQITERKNRIVFHPVCTTYKMNLVQKLQKIGDACAQKAEIPFLSGCCGMAGDRGFYYPKLTASATKDEAGEVDNDQYEGYYSSGKTCEMALSEATHQNYQSIFYLLRDVTKTLG
jgi:D-lactate dehydrogenase